MGLISTKSLLRSISRSFPLNFVSKRSSEESIEIEDILFLTDKYLKSKYAVISTRIEISDEDHQFFQISSPQQFVQPAIVQGAHPLS